MIRDGKTYHAKLADHGGSIGVYAGNLSGFPGEPAGIPLYRFDCGICRVFDADSRFAGVPGQEWVEEYFRGDHRQN
jgi:hypothetical protein